MREVVKAAEQSAKSRVRGGIKNLPDKGRSNYRTLAEARATAREELRARWKIEDEQRAADDLARAQILPSHISRMTPDEVKEINGSGLSAKRDAYVTELSKLSRNEAEAELRKVADAIGLGDSVPTMGELRRMMKKK